MKKRIWIFVVIILIAAVAGYLWWRSWAATDPNAQYQTAVVERGTLTATIGATGSVRSNQSAILAWQTTGAIGVINIRPGEKVGVGDVLAQLSQTSLPQTMILAQVDLVTAQRSLDDLRNSGTQGAQAQVNLMVAQQNRDSAQSALNRLLMKNRGATSEDITNAQAQVTVAQEKLRLSELFYNTVKDISGADAIEALAYTNLYSARLSLSQAQGNLYFFYTTPSEHDINEARAKLTLAEAQLADAQREWERLKNGPDPRDIAAAQVRIDAIQATLNMAQISAPFAGTVTVVVGMVGDQVAPGTRAFRIDDLSHLLVDVQVSEMDVNDITIGQSVAVAFDAIADQEYHGNVVKVAQAGETVQGVVNFTVTVELTDADVHVKPGMTAAVTVQVKQLENVILVQNRAVRVVNGQRVVYILKAGVLTPVNITLGSSSDAVSEVVAGDLKVGDVVVLNPPAINFSPGGGIFGGGN